MELERFIREKDYVYEEELLRDPYSVKKWLQYVVHRQVEILEEEENNPTKSISKLLEKVEPVNFIFERALVALPSSYKLWKTYLDQRVDYLMRLLQVYRDRPTRSNDDDFNAEGKLLMGEFVTINKIYERALKFLYSMPRLWLDYAAFLMRQRRITLTRATLDRALRALPFTQHDRIWGLYLKFATALERIRPLGAAEIWSRYWRVAADRSDAKIATRHLSCLLQCGFYDDAASLLVELAQNEPPTLSSEASQALKEDEIMPGQYWQELCRIITLHGAAVKKTPVEAVFREAITKAMARSNFGSLQQRRDRDGPIHATGIFWNALATWHIRQGRLDVARSIYEEAISSVPTVRDFALVFDAYAKMEESIISITFEKKNRKKSKKNDSESIDNELEARMAHFENLMDRRPFLLSDVCLRQQPNNVSAWEERIQLVKTSGKSYEQVIETFENAIDTIHARRAKGGSLSNIWKDYAKYVQENPDKTKDWQAIYRRAVKSDFSNVEELAAVWIAFAESEMKEATTVVLAKDDAGGSNDHSNRGQLGDGLSAALDLLAEALVPQRLKDPQSPQNFLFKNIKLWNYYLDLEEARGLPDATRCAYERVIELGIATPQTFINYALFLEGLCPPETEEAFRIYERGASVFGYPVAFELWNVYLPKYVAYYAPRGSLERIRDLFEQALRGCPNQKCHTIYIEYAVIEEQYGSARNAIRILDRAAHTVSDERKMEIFDLWLSKVQSLLGAIAQRSVYEEAISILPVAAATEMSMRYASLETSLGEFERTRAIYAHAASNVDPRLNPALWAAWQEFETRNGTEETFRDMLRVKRAVTSKFSSSLVFIPEQQNIKPYLQQDKEKEEEEEEEEGETSIIAPEGDADQKTEIPPLLLSDDKDKVSPHS